MQAKRRPYRKEASYLLALLKDLYHRWQVCIGETITLACKKHLLIRDMIAHRQQTLAYIAPYSSVNHRDTPVFLWVADYLDGIAKTRDNTVGIVLRSVV